MVSPGPGLGLIQVQLEGYWYIYCRYGMYIQHIFTLRIWTVVILFGFIVKILHLVLR